MKLSELLKLLDFDMCIRVFMLGTDDAFDYENRIKVGEVPFKLIDRQIRKITFPDDYCMTIELLNEELQANGDYADG